MTLLIKSFVGALLLFGIVYCLKVVPERVFVLYIDKEVFGYSKFYVSRHGRKSGYYMNMEGTVLKPWYNNVTVHLIFYEYLHNEYRRSFVEMHFKMCDFLQKEAYIGGMLKNIGVSCPIFGEYHLMNMTVPTENFPYVLPFEKARMDLILNATAPAADVMIYHAQLYIHFKK